ncbi:tryptophan-rich sensory protein [Hymenobacter sp. HMF4947]|uniref:Tryptophan-rich sensory protein n=1 Tax=Hymenobacter ginkgonis TaxID=2682976 RepID=A0A7K1TIA5_9BACT|nr:tryptophan-rich sensory protein [Hymenobacter ginkgonis]MVN77891.1 tryptophan-rich sensory protein [Hymenobacter ginkgonis]
METSTSASRFWRWLLPAAVAGCLYVNYLYNVHPPAGALSNGAMSARHPTLLTPAGYAFSIWGVIFAGLVAYTVWQLLPAQRFSRLVARLTPVLALAVLATTAWTLVFSYELIGPSLVVMLAILGLLAVAYARSRPLVLAGQAPAWPTWFLSLYLGWIMLATVLNVIFGLRDAAGVQWPADANLLGSHALVVVAAGLGTALAWRGHDALLPLPLAWGLVGTWAAQRGAAPHLATTALGAAVALGVGAVLAIWSRQRQPRPQMG